MSEGREPNKSGQRYTGTRYERRRRRTEVQRHGYSRGSRMQRRTLIVGGAALTFSWTAIAQPREPTSGIWLRIADANEAQRAVQLLQERNAVFTRNGHAAPWRGVIFEQTWGQVEHAAGRWHLEAAQRVLDVMASAGLLAVVQVSDKEWQYQAHDERYGAPVPVDLDAGPIAREAFGSCPEGLCQDRHRYATLHDNTVRGRPGSAVRKYVAKRWALEERWAAMWRALGQSIGSHPALYGVLGPESALALPESRHLAQVGYPGSDWYAGYLVRQAMVMRAAFPQRVQVISNINVVPPDNARALPPVIDRLATLGLSIWAQDLNPAGQAYRVLYALLDRFPPERRWAMVTNTTNLAPGAMVEFANELGVGHLAFLHTGFHDQVRAIERRAGSQTSFLPSR